MTLHWNWGHPLKKARCRHYKLQAAPELGDEWVRCLQCGREYQVDKPARHQVHATQERPAARDGVRKGPK